MDQTLFKLTRIMLKANIIGEYKPWCYFLLNEVFYDGRDLISYIEEIKALIAILPSGLDKFDEIFLSESKLIQFSQQYISNSYGG